MKRKVWMIFPSHNQDWATTMIGSLEHMEHFMKCYNVGILVHAQWPHTRASVREMRDAFLDHGAKSWHDVFSTQSVVKSWKMEELGCPIATIRNACFRGTVIEPGDIIFNLDDDFEFSGGTLKYHWSSGDHYSDVIEYMFDNPRCGSVMCTGHLGGTGKERTIYPRVHDLWATNRGLFLLRIPEMKLPLVPTWSLRMRGTMEETAMVYSRIAEGLYPAKTMNCPTIHRNAGNASRDAHDDPLHYIEYQYLHTTKYIREKWDQPDWDYEKRRLPQGLIKEYLEAGGDPEMLRT